MARGTKKVPASDYRVPNKSTFMALLWKRPCFFSCTAYKRGVVLFFYSKSIIIT